MVVGDRDMTVTVRRREDCAEEGGVGLGEIC